MIQTVSVSASGPAFTFLLYENLKNEFGQEGFLLGEIIQKETKTITDNDQQQTYVTKVIKITGVVPCPKRCYFYNGVGKIDHEKLKTVLEGNLSRVVAWYIYRPSTCFKLMVRERLIHKQLCDFFDMPQDLFSVCLLISECTPNGSTHSYTQTFMRCKNNRFDKLPFHIVNLTDNKNSYRSAEPPSASFQEIINKLDSTASQGISFITKLQESVQSHMESVVKNLAAEEENLFNLEEEIRELMRNQENEKKEILMPKSTSVDESLINTSKDFTTENVTKVRRKRVRQAKAITE